MTLQIDERAARSAYERRRDEWLYEDRYDARPQPSFSDDEARTLRLAHTPLRAVAETEFIFATKVGTTHYCGECFQPWEGGGCPTIRLLQQWHTRGQRVSHLETRNASMAQFLAEWFAKRFVGPGRNGFDYSLAECKLVVDRRMLEQGRMLVVDELLRKMRDQWKDYLLKLFPPSPMEVAARAFNESLANIEREKRRAQADGE